MTQDDEDEPGLFLNHYSCPQCKTKWTDKSSCDFTSQIDIDCPSCGCNRVYPHKSEAYPWKS